MPPRLFLRCVPSPAQHGSHPLSSVPVRGSVKTWSSRDDSIPEALHLMDVPSQVMPMEPGQALVLPLPLAKAEESPFPGPDAAPPGEPSSPETACQLFRQFPYQVMSGPHETLRQLRKLCFQWLQPELHTKEQILEMLLLEQFLTILPGEIQMWVRKQCPGSGEEAVTLVESLKEDPQRLLQWVSRAGAIPRSPLGPQQACCLFSGPDLWRFHPHSQISKSLLPPRCPAVQFPCDPNDPAGWDPADKGQSHEAAPFRTPATSCGATRACDQPAAELEVPTPSLGLVCAIMTQRTQSTLLEFVSWLSGIQSG